MKVIERVRYGSRGQGSLIRYEGVANWYSVYWVNGTEVRETTETTDLKAARRFHELYFDGLGAEGETDRALREALTRDFGSVDRCRGGVGAMGDAGGGGRAGCSSPICTGTTNW